jgi:hypothetical protein
MKTAERTAKALEQASKEYDEKIQALFADLKAEITSLPDNPRITRLGGGNCFAMKASDLQGNWSAKHHDFKSQYESVAEELERVADSKDIIKRLRTIIKDEGVRVRSKETSYWVKLHPDVVEHLKGLL